MAVTRTLGAQFEISIDGKPRSYLDRKSVAIEAAEHLKRKYPNSEIAIREMPNGGEIEIKYKSELGRDGKK
jgi:hypothetical protein